MENAAKVARHLLEKVVLDISDVRDLLDSLEILNDAVKETGGRSLSLSEAWDEIDEIYIAMSEASEGAAS